LFLSVHPKDEASLFPAHFLALTIQLTPFNPLVLPILGSQMFSSPQLHLQKENHLQGCQISELPSQSVKAEISDSRDNKAS